MLLEALATVEAQAYRPLEIIVVDDGSSDGTADMLADRPGIRTVRNPVARGPSAARNRGILAASGEFIALLDSDDLWHPDKLTRQVEVMQRHPECGMVGGGCVYVSRDGHPTGASVQGPERISFEECAVFTAVPGSSSNVLLRRRVFSEVGLFDESLMRTEDRDLWMRIAERFEVRCVPEPTVSIRVHGLPRPNEGFELARECRMRVNRRISNPTLRRKAQAWMWFSCFQVKLRAGKIHTALGYLIRSMIAWPLGISRRTRRLRRLPAAFRSAMSRRRT